MDRPPERQRRVVRAFLELPEAERLEVVEELLTYLAGDLNGVDDERLETLRRREEALQAVVQATSHLRESGELGPSQPISSSRFTEVAKELGLDRNAAAVTRIFGRWRNATAAAAGEQIREGPAERRLRRRVLGRDMGREDYLEGVRLWLKSKPDAETGTEYDDFVRAENRKRGGERRLVVVGSLRSALGLPWPVIVQVARGDVSLVAAQQAERDRLLETFEGELIGGRDVAVVLGFPPGYVNNIAGTEGFPSWVAFLGRTRAYLLEDVVAYRDGRPVPARKMGELPAELLQAKDVAAVISVTHGTVVTYVHKELWHLVPRPSGRVGQVHYWWKRDVASWQREREQEDSGG